MLSRLLKIWRRHGCEEDQHDEPSRNRAIVHFGVIWQCPDCRTFWYREVEFVEGIVQVWHIRQHGSTIPLWRKMNWLQIRKLRRLTRLGLTQLEIAEQMNFRRPLNPGSPYNPTWLNGIEKINQDPASWAFGRVRT